MTTTSILPQPLRAMYADTAIHFRDPFAHDTRRAAQTDRPGSRQRVPTTRALAPPFDMNGLSQHSTKLPNLLQEHGNVSGYGDKLHHYYQAPSRPAAPAYMPPQVSNTEYGRYGQAQGRVSRPASPNLSASKPGAFDTQSQSQSRRGSQNTSIAPSFQIPRSVNDSGGSLAELAAQITCLFWFESSDLLKQVESSPDAITPPRKLIPEATPSTGFKKFVTTLLSTTMVAQNVVLLALLFIYRLKKLNVGVRGKEGSEFRLLTVALMLGNKFLDDNTYTNKTWAEVSGINVGEVHIMEVEFLSNMKYCLFTSAEDWSQWQSLLGRFAAFFDRATRVQSTYLPAPVLPPASSLHLPMTLPSPPASNQASPPFGGEQSHGGYPYYAASQHGPTPAPSPLTAMPLNGMQGQQSSQPQSRKRSHDDFAAEPSAKRAATESRFGSPRHQPNTTMPAHANQPVPRLTLPSMSLPPSQNSATAYSTHSHQQLPPLVVPNRAMAMVYPSGHSQSTTPQPFAASGTALQPRSSYQSRQHSPCDTSAGASPSSHLPRSATSTLHPTSQISPSYFLQQRNSPYRPVHNVNTLLHPPPSAAMQHRSRNVDYNQMHYQPIGKASQQRQSGRLPYIAQNIWLDGNHQQAMTPVSQWSGFQHLSQQPQHQSQTSMPQQQQG
ncbi:hypothetical protein MBLNU230_g0043t1 [Neophaeotheca triangularis]